MLANQLFRFAFGAQVKARRIDGGLQGRDLQKTRDARGTRGLQDALRKLRVGAAEPGPAEAALVENADEIDHDVLAAEALAELRFLVDIAVLAMSVRAAPAGVCAAPRRATVR